MKSQFDWGKIGPLAVGSCLLILVVAVGARGRVPILDPWERDTIVFDDIHVGGADAGCSPEALDKLPFDEKVRTARTNMELGKMRREEAKTSQPAQGDSLRAQADGFFLCADRAFDAALREAAGFGPKEKKYTDLLNEAAYYHLYDRNGIDRALALFTQLAQVREAGFGPLSPDLALDLNKLANVQNFAGRPAEAEKHFRRALDIVVANPSNPDAKRTVAKDYSFFLNGQGRKDEAQEVLKK